MDLSMDVGQGGKEPQQQGCAARVGGVWMRQRRARSKVVVEWRNKEGGRGGGEWEGLQYRGGNAIEIGE